MAQDLPPELQATAQGAGISVGDLGGGGGGQIYMGEKSVSHQRGGPKDERAPVTFNEAHYVSATEATNEYYRFSAKQKASFRAKLLAASMIKATDGPDAEAAVWAGLVTMSSKYTDARNQGVSPWDVLAMYAPTNPKRGARVDGSYTTTSSEVNLTDPETAKAIINRALTDTLGREATPSESKLFRTALAAKEKDNPNTRTTTQTIKGGLVTGSTSTAGGGVSADAMQQMAQDQGKGSSEYGAHQAATTYYNAMVQALGSTVGG